MKIAKHRLVGAYMLAPLMLPQLFFYILNPIVKSDIGGGKNFSLQNGLGQAISKYFLPSDRENPHSVFLDIPSLPLY